MMNYVLGFAFNREKTEVLLILKARPKWQIGKLNGIGGKIEETDKSATDAMQREFEEETGCKLDLTWDLYARLESDNIKVFVFRAFMKGMDMDFILKNQIGRETDEPIKNCSIWYLNNTNVIDNLHWLIPMALDPQHTDCHASFKIKEMA